MRYIRRKSERPGGPRRNNIMTKFRRIEGKDREAVRSLVEGTGAFKPHEVDVAMELVDEALAQTGQDDYHPLVLEEEDGTVVAYACFGKNPMTKATSDLYWLATRADRRGKGYGRRIVAFVEEEVKRRGEPSPFEQGFSASGNPPIVARRPQRPARAGSARGI
jgi:GNAT superfamily N-acetyltransferase